MPLKKRHHSREFGSTKTSNSTGRLVTRLGPVSKHKPVSDSFKIVLVLWRAGRNSALDTMRLRLQVRRGNFHRPALSAGASHLPDVLWRCQDFSAIREFNLHEPLDPKGLEISWAIDAVPGQYVATLPCEISNWIHSVSQDYLSIPVEAHEIGPGISQDAVGLYVVS